MWNDNDTKVDYLGFDTLIEPALGILKKPVLFPVTIGIFGDWGSGKSSLMNMLHEKLENENDYLCIKFNGWLFEGYEDAKSALLTSILLGLKQNETIYNKSKDSLKRLAKKVNWMRLMGFASKQVITYTLNTQGASLPTSIPQFEDLGSIINEEADKDGLEQSIQDFRNDFSQMLEKTNLEALVIFIDDLDRCLPERIIETLEAIKLFLAVPKTAFVIGADERIIKHAISSRYLGLQTVSNQPSYDVARDYLEKIIQFPLYIPTLNNRDTESFMTLLFSQVYLDDEDCQSVINKTQENRLKSVLDVPINIGILKDTVKNYPEDLDTALSFIDIVAPVLCIGLKGNPRLIKRFLNTLILRQKIAKTRKVDLNIKVLSKLMLLEYFRQDRFTELFSWQSENSGRALPLQELENGTTIDREELKLWTDDPWTMKWLTMEPKISEIDLGPYFYFSREKIPSAIPVLRVLSQQLQEIFNQLISDTGSLRKSGLGKIGSLELSELEEIFEVLTQRYISQVGEGSDVKEWIMEALIEVVTQRYELKSKFITFLRNLSVNDMNPTLPLRLMRMTTESDKYSEFKDLVQSWSFLQGKFGNAAKSALRRTQNQGK